MLDAPDLRPTTDRVRETLFNWLNVSIINARCLDVFAGSGILGFEALSREAQSVTAIEKSAAVCQELRKNAQHLSAEHYQIVEQNSLNFLQNCSEQFDLIFLDPPFNQIGLLIESLKIINARHLLAKSGKLYVELPEQKVLELEAEIGELVWLKRKKAGQVCYALAQFLE